MTFTSSRFPADAAPSSSADGPAEILQAVSGTPLVIPGDAWLLNAEFARQGPDLVLSGDDGGQVLVRDFFALETPPDLTTSSGAMIGAPLATRLAGPMAPAQYAQAQPAASAEPIGQIEAIDGTVEVIRADGTRISLTKGDELFQGDVLESSPGAAIGVVLVDDSTFSMGENGRMVLDEMIYDADTGTGKAAFNMVQGVFSLVSGKIAESAPDQMTLTTPVGTIGIRGTTIATNSQPPPAPSTVSLLQDGDGSVGEISFTNAGGAQVINQAGGTIALNSFFQAPPPPVFLSPAQIQQQYGSALNALPPSPADDSDDADAQEEDAGEEVAEGEEGEGEGEEGEGEGEELAEGEGEEGEGEELAEGEGEEGEGEEFAEGEEGEGEGEEVVEGEGEEGEGEGEEVVEGEGAPEDENAAAGEDTPEDEQVAEGEGPHDEGPGPEGGDVARDAFEEAIEAGASEEEAFAAAAEAASQEAIAEGADPVAVAAAAEAAQAAYEAAIAAGASPEEAMAAAESAAQAAAPDAFNGDDGGTGGFGGPGPGEGGGDGPGPGPGNGPGPGDGGGSGSGEGGSYTGTGDYGNYGGYGGYGDHDGDYSIYGGSGDDEGGYYEGLGGPGRFEGGGGSGGIDGGGYFFFEDDDDDDHGDDEIIDDVINAPPEVIFGEEFSHTSDSDIFTGNTVNTEFVYSQIEGGGFGGTDVIDDAGGNRDRITFEDLDNVVLSMQELSGDTTRVEIRIATNILSGSNGGSTNSSTLTSALSSPVNTISLSKAVEDLQALDTGLEDLNSGGVTLFGATSSLDATAHSFSGSETGYIVAGTNANETIDLSGFSSGLLGTIIFGKGGDDVLIAGGGEGNILFGGSGNDSLTGDSGDDVLNGGGDNDTFLFGASTGNDVIQGGDGIDTLAPASTSVTAFSLTNTTFTGIETINLTGGAAAGVSVTAFGSQLGGITSITGDGTNDKLLLVNGADLTNISLSGIDTIRVDADNNNTAGTTTLAVTSSTSLAGTTFTTGSNTNHTHLQSDDGLNVTGATLFVGGSGTNSIILDSSGDTAGAVLTANVSTNFIAGGGITEIRDAEGISGGGDEIIQSVDGLNLGGVVLNGIAQVNIDSDNSGVSALTVNSATNLGGTTVNGGSDANDVIQVAVGGATVSFASTTLNNISQIIGSASADNITGPGSGDIIITGGQGADALYLTGSGSHTVRFDAANEFGDTINSFTAGGTNDLIDFNANVSRGAGNVFESLATGNAVGANTAVVSYTTDVTNFATDTDVATALNALTGLAAGNTMLFAVGNGIDSEAWYWTDGGGGTADGVVEAAELSQVAQLSGVDNDSLTAADFDGFA
ncbi:MAG: FecR domain-containing protein [Rhodospirillales bacterium]|nr:FecR domain-containing protein [Rhodospirillales bacterium]